MENNLPKASPTLKGLWPHSNCQIALSLIDSIDSRRCRWFLRHHLVAFDPPVAVFEHANRVIKATVGLCTNLNSHCFPLNLMCFYDCRPFDCDPVLKRPGGHEALMLLSSSAQVAHSLSEHRSSKALHHTDFPSKRVRGLVIHHKFP